MSAVVIIQVRFTQISTAVTEKDKITQANAGGAHESASAAEELNTPANSMRNAVMDLASLAGARARLYAKPTPPVDDIPAADHRAPQLDVKTPASNGQCSNGFTPIRTKLETATPELFPQGLGSSKEETTAIW